MNIRQEYEESRRQMAQKRVEIHVCEGIIRKGPKRDLTNLYIEMHDRRESLKEEEAEHIERISKEAAKLTPQVEETEYYIKEALKRAYREDWAPAKLEEVVLGYLNGYARIISEIKSRVCKEDIEAADPRRESPECIEVDGDWIKRTVKEYIEEPKEQEAFIERIAEYSRSSRPYNITEEMRKIAKIEEGDKEAQKNLALMLDYHLRGRKEADSYPTLTGIRQLVYN